MTKKPLAFIDIETTGFSPKKHEIIEFAGIKALPDSEEVEILELRIRPKHIETASQQALKIVGYNEEAWEDAIELEDAIKQIVDFLRGCILVGHSVRFDCNFIKKNALEHRAGLIPLRTIDTLDLAKRYLEPKGLTKFGLAGACTFLGISNANAHTAMADAFRCKQVYDRIMGDFVNDDE